MGKKMWKACAFILASLYCLQPVYAQSEVATQSITESSKKAEDKELGMVKLKARQVANEANTYKMIVSHNATVRNGQYKDQSFATSDGVIPRDILEVKTAKEDGYSRRGYMEFGLPEDQYKGINWDTVEKVTLTLTVKEFFGTDKTNNITVYNTTHSSDEKWNEENVTWNTAPSLVYSTEAKTNALHTETVSVDKVGQKVHIDLTQALKEHFKAETAEEGNIRLGLGLGVEGIFDQGGVKFYSRNHDGGVYAPYITIYEAGYVDSIAPTVAVKGLVDGQKVNDSIISLEAIAEDNYDKNVEPIVTLNGVKVDTKGEHAYKVTLQKGENIIEIKAIDAAGNEGITKSFRVIYEEKERYQAIADAQVWDRNKDANYGDLQEIDIKTTLGGGYTREYYVGFSLSDLDVDYIKSAKIRVHVSQVRGTVATKAYEDISVYTTTPFDEMGITWNNKNEPLEKVAHTQVNRSKPGEYFEADITSYVNGKLLKGEKLENEYFILKIDNEYYNDNTGLLVSSRESDYKPMIEIERGLPAPTVEVNGITNEAQVTGGTLTITVDSKSVSDTVKISTEVAVNGKKVAGVGNEYVLPLEYGKNEIQVKVTDEADNVVTKSYTVTRLEYQEAGIYYVDSENGNDTADGTSPKTAWKSLDKLNSIHFQPGTTISFKKGGVWQGQFKPIGSGREGAPIVINTYGEGNRPIIDGQGISSIDTNSKFPEGAVQLENVSHYEVSGLEVINKGEEDDQAFRAGILALALGAGEIEHIYIKDCYVRDVNSSCASSRSNKFSGGILVVGDTRDKQGNPLNQITKFDDIIVEDCHVKNVAIEGIRTKTWDNGKDAQDKRNSNVIFRNNLVEDVHGDGIVISEIEENGLVEKNIIRRHSSCPTTLNYAGCWVWDSKDTIFQYNEIYDGVYGYNDGEAFDFDIGSENVTYQYNYSHGNRGGFLLTMSGLKDGNVFRYNISKNDGNGTEIFFCANDKPLIHNNTIYIGEGVNVPYFINENSGAKFNFVNNIVQVDGTLGAFSRGLSSASRFENNCLYPASVAELAGNPLNHPGLVTENPMLVNPVAKDINMDTWIQEIWNYKIGNFKVVEGSPVIDAGVNIENNGGQDIYGNPLYANGTADIGAHEFVAESKNPGVIMSELQEVEGGKEFEVAVGIKNVDELIYAKDLVVKFDETLFDFVNAKGVGHAQVVDTKVENGKVRILLATEGGAVSGTESVILRLAPVRVNSQTISAITISDISLGIVTDGVSQIVEVGGASQTIVIKESSTVEVDKTQLTNAISQAKQLSQEASVGDDVGQYPQSAKDALDEAIKEAQKVEVASTSQNEVDHAVSTLRMAIHDFRNSQIKAVGEDINQDGKVDVADLALVAYYYKVELGDANWEKAKVADINRDGKVDIIDLTCIASKILGK